MKNKFFRTLAVTLAAVLCFTAFSTTAFAGGADPDPAPLPEETGIPTTGGIELDTEDAEGGNNTSSTTEDTENTDTEKSTGAAETMTDEEMAELLSYLLGSQVDVTVTDEGIQLTNKDDGTPNQTGTVVTNGGNLNVRTGAGTDNQAFTQLPNGTQVEVIGTEDNGWVKILLPEREGYVCGDYLTVSDAATGDGDFSLTLNGDELSALLEQFGGSAGGSAPPTPGARACFLCGRAGRLVRTGAPRPAAEKAFCAQSTNPLVFLSIRFTGRNTPGRPCSCRWQIHPLARVWSG